MYENNCDLHQKNSKWEHEKVEKGALRSKKQRDLIRDLLDMVL